MQRVILRLTSRLLDGPAFRPGFPRAVMGFVIGTISGIVVFAILRVILGLGGLINLTDLFPNSGATLMLGGFGGAAGWLWGVGAFDKYSHDHGGIEHNREIHGDTKPGLLYVGLEKTLDALPGIIRAIIPLIKPLLVTIGICVVVVVVFMILGMIPGPISPARVQSEIPLASAVTPAGDIILPIGGPDGTPINKTVFFVLAAFFLIIGPLGTMAIVLALVFSALNRQVNAAKQAAPNPPTTQPTLFRLGDFIMTWIAEIMSILNRSVTR